MFTWLSRLFKPTTDKTEERLLRLFGFLLSDHNFSFSKEILGNAIDENGKFFFYGPLIAYQFYNENICINILHLVQRDDYNVYITDKKTTDQIYIRKGTELPSFLAYNLPFLAKEIKESVFKNKELFGQSI